MSYHDKYDVIVVGAGNAALCAALSAKEKGSNVLVLERGPKEKRGGNSYFTDGAIRTAYRDLENLRKVIPHMTDEKAALIEMPKYDEQDYLADIMRVTERQSDPELAGQLVSKSFETIQWMHKQGVQFELNFENQSFVQEGKHHFWGGLPLRTTRKGIGLMEQLFKKIDEEGIDIWYKSRAVKLNVHEGTVTGINVEKEGKILTVKADAIVLACGSFEANKQMRKQYLGDEWDAAIVRGTEYNTGDGLAMALEAGAQRYGEWSGCHAIGTDYNAPKTGDFQKPGDIFKKHSYPYSIMLNERGERFVDEGEDFRNYTYAKYGKEVLKQPNHIAYQIYDSQVRPILRKEYDLEEATFYVGDTLEELIEQLPVDKSRFLETIQNYNAAVQEGDFDPTIKDGKSTLGINPPKSNWALPIEQGPFYAYPVTCGITFSFGGLRTDNEGRVLTINGEALKGLFAAGEMIGGIFYKNYPGGSGLMSGAVYGKLAGTAASEYISNCKEGVSR